MDLNLATIVISSFLSFVASYAVLNQRVKTLEEKQEKYDEHVERLIRVETKLDILIQQFKKHQL